MLRVSFSTGFSFHYWPNETGQSKYQAKYRPAHKVKAKFRTLKEEILESGFLTAEQWETLVELKVQKYMKTGKARQMKASNDGGSNTGQLPKSSPVTKQHLAAIILYCDFSKLCTAFSGTFRRLNVFESIESVTFRHSKFAIFGRLLVEAVCDFGEKGSGRGGEFGPFFCGLSGNINIGSYAIRLEGPCSTTTKREIALNFAKGDGVVMSLKNHSGDVKKQTFLNCSWISNFHEEAERLWIAGKYLLRIVSIVIVKTAKNYQKVIRALYLFDCMISKKKSVQMDNISVKETPQDSDLISSLFDFSLNSTGTTALDSYLKRDCELFLQKKETVTLSMRKIFYYLKNMSKLMLYNIVENYETGIKGMDNVIRPEWISCFPSLKTVIIDGAAIPSRYQFRLEALLETVKQISPDITVNVWDAEEWCQEAITDEILQIYDSAGYHMEYEKNESKWYSCLIIKSKKL